jgi:serine/threonine-protein kinase
LPEAVAAYREAIRLKPDLPQAHYVLGLALEEQGKFGEALGCLRKGQDLGARLPRWSSARGAADIRRVERLVELDRNLAAFLAGKRKPSGSDEQFELASLWGHPAKRLYAAAARFSEDAFAARPALMDNVRAGHRYQAACYAVLAGCGRGEDTADLNKKVRARRREQARQWLRADLVLHANRLKSGNLTDCTKVLETMDGCLADARLVGVRSTDLISRLPVEERERWAKLRKDVEDLRMKVREMSN